MVLDGVNVFQSYGAWSNRPMNDTLFVRRDLPLKGAVIGTPAVESRESRELAESADVPVNRAMSRADSASEVTGSLRNEP